MKIRRKRDYDWEPTNEDFPEALADDNGVEASPTQGDSGSQAASELSYEGIEAASGASWLANDVIIGSLPDNKLRAALARYKAIVRLCEAELAARAVTPQRYSRFDECGSFVSRYVPRKDGPQSYAKAARPRKKPAKQTVAPSGFTPEQLIQALSMLLEKQRQKRTTDEKP